MGDGSRRWGAGSRESGDRGQGTKRARRGNWCSGGGPFGYATERRDAAGSGSWDTQTSRVSIHDLKTFVQYYFWPPHGRGGGQRTDSKEQGETQEKWGKMKRKRRDGSSGDAMRTVTSLAMNCVWHPLSWIKVWCDPRRERPAQYWTGPLASCSYRVRAAACLWRGAEGARRRGVQRMNCCPWEREQGQEEMGPRMKRG